MATFEEIMAVRRKALLQAGHARGFEEGIAACAEIVREAALNAPLTPEQKEVLLETTTTILRAADERARNEKRIVRA